MKRKDSRSYITVHDDMMNHPKIEALTDPAKVHLIRLWGHCNRFSTDGIVSKPKAMEKGKRVFEQLTGGPEPLLIAQSDGSFYCHDYLEHQWSKAEKETMAQVNKERGTHGMHKRWHLDRGIRSADCEHCQNR